MDMLAVEIPVAIIAQQAVATIRPEDDAGHVAALDLRFQAAVKQNDAATIDAILHEKYRLVLGDGTTVSREQLIEEARSKSVIYEIQDEDPGTQSVMIWGDTAVVTARLRIKGKRSGAPFDRTLWFTDTYIRTAAGWRYAYAQASLPLPANSRSEKGDGASFPVRQDSSIAGEAPPIALADHARI